MLIELISQLARKFYTSAIFEKVHSIIGVRTSQQNSSMLVEEGLLFKKMVRLMDTNLIKGGCPEAKDRSLFYTGALAKAFYGKEN